jgi:hypothetical protein
MISELPIEKLSRRCDPQEVGCDTSAELVTRGNIIGQERALSALKFGLGIQEKALIFLCLGCLEQVIPQPSMMASKS